MDEHLGELYGAPLEQFVSLRNEIARRLRDEGDQDEAARVTALKKPSVSAWVVNQLSRSHSDELDALIAAGEALEQAQRQSLKGEARSTFDDARRGENDAIVRLRQAAVEGGTAVSAGTLERVINTFRAGAASPEGRTLLRQGRLSADLESSGFDPFMGALGLPADDQPPAEHKPAGESKAVQRRLEALRQKAEQANQAAEAAAKEARQAEAAADDAEKVAKRARKQAVDASHRAEAAGEKARRLDEELAETSRNGQ